MSNYTKHAIHESKYNLMVVPYGEHFHSEIAAAPVGSYIAMLHDKKVRLISCESISVNAPALDSICWSVYGIGFKAFWEHASSNWKNHIYHDKVLVVAYEVLTKEVRVKITDLERVKKQFKACRDKIEHNMAMGTEVSVAVMRRYAYFSYYLQVCEGNMARVYLESKLGLYECRLEEIVGSAFIYYRALGVNVWGDRKFECVRDYKERFSYDSVKIRVEVLKELLK